MFPEEVVCYYPEQSVLLSWLLPPAYQKLSSYVILFFPFFNLLDETVPAGHLSFDFDLEGTPVLPGELQKQFSKVLGDVLGHKTLCLCS